jgi:hypothetical protein
MLLDQDKKWSSKAKKEVCFCENFCSLCRSKSLQEFVVAVFSAALVIISW